ncbi:MAG: hypothetical protein HYW45_02995 [Candidatus Daviesbacteria bacterium]|nr:MAG: hypothetical protein HYW45_02995 [Candidatus Daviesbacteria bacterium]
MDKKKSLTNFILLVLEKTVDGIVRYDDLIHHTHQYAWSGGWKKPLKKSELSQALKRLRENRLIDLIDDKNLIYRLTDSGKDKALWTKMRFEEEKWDGKWRLVIWDIPEKRRVARDLLRHKLKFLGFTQLQRSIWMTKKNCTKLLRDFIKEVGIKDWVRVVETTDIEL